MPLAVEILSKLDYRDRGSPALPKDSRVEYNWRLLLIKIRVKIPIRSNFKK